MGPDGQQQCCQEIGRGKVEIQPANREHGVSLWCWSLTLLSRGVSQCVRLNSDDGAGFVSRGLRGVSVDGSDAGGNVALGLKRTAVGAIGGGFAV
jgi:hypothetical protein